MVKLKKEDKEGRHLYFLQEIVKKEKIAQITREMSCGQ